MPLARRFVALSVFVPWAAHGKICDASDPVLCADLTGGVRMPLVALGTGASSYLSECDEKKPNPPFRNMTCFSRLARESTHVWLQLGGAAVEMAQVDRNMIPVGEALAALGTPREDVFLETKCWGSPGFDATVECAADSMQMLGTSYLDLLLLHHPQKPSPGCWGSPVWDQPCTGPPTYDPGPAGRQDSWRALEVLVKAGRVRAIGLSDFSVAQIEEILQVANITPAVLETHWAPTAHDDALLAFCKQHGITLQAWGALASGTWGKSILSSPVIMGIAAAHSVSTAQVVLRWSVQQGVAVIAGTGNPQHMRSDLDIFGFALSDAEMQAISAMQPGLAGQAVHV